LLLDNKLDGSPQTDAQIRRARTWIAVSYASVSGILSGMCLIFAKSGVELLVLTVSGQNQFWRWESWVLVGGLIIFALLQILYLHKSLVLVDPTLVCPRELLS
jgi:magnesium transporter